MKGVAEQSSVFASEIFTAISPIPAIIHKTEIKKFSSPQSSNLVGESFFKMEKKTVI